MHPIPIKMHTLRTLLVNFSQFASDRQSFGMPIVFLVSRMPPASAATLQGLEARFSNHWITSSCSCDGPTEESDPSCLPSNPATTKSHSALSELRHHVGGEDATARVLCHCYGLSKLQGRDSINFECECVTASVSTYIILNGLPSTLELEPWSQLSTEV